MRDSLLSFDKTLSVSEGNGPPEDVDIIYTTVRAGKTVRQIPNDVQRRLLYVMLVLQNADAKPTESQSTAVRDGEAAVVAMETQWRAFTDESLRHVNAMLMEHQLEILKPE